MRSLNSIPMISKSEIMGTRGVNELDEKILLRLAKEPELDWRENKMSAYKLYRELGENEQTVYSAVNRLHRYGFLYKRPVGKLKRKNANRAYPLDHEQLEKEYRENPWYSRAVGRLTINPAVKELIQNPKERKAGFFILADMVDRLKRYPPEKGSWASMLALSFIDYCFLNQDRIPIEDKPFVKAYLMQIVVSLQHWEMMLMKPIAASSKGALP